MKRIVLWLRFCFCFFHLVLTTIQTLVQLYHCRYQMKNHQSNCWFLWDVPVCSGQYIFEMSKKKLWWTSNSTQLLKFLANSEWKDLHTQCITVCCWWCSVLCWSGQYSVMSCRWVVLLCYLQQRHVPCAKLHNTWVGRCLSASLQSPLPFLVSLHVNFITYYCMYTVG